MSFRLLREFLRICLWFFFRRIELEGDEHVPKTGPLMLVPNHVNALIDPLVISAIMKRPLTMTARDTLKEHKFLAFLMRTFRVVGFHRAQDGGSMRKNVEAMQ